MGKKTFDLKTKPQPSKMLLFGVTVARVVGHSFIHSFMRYLPISGSMLNSEDIMINKSSRCLESVGVRQQS